MEELVRVAIWIGTPTPVVGRGLERVRVAVGQLARSIHGDDVGGNASLGQLRFDDLRFAEVVKAQLAEAGITANVVPVDGARQLADGNSHTLESTTYNWSGRPDPDGNTYQFFHTTPGVSLNWAGMSNPQDDQLLEQTRQVSDHAERKKLYSQITQMLLDEAPAVFVV